ncbi:UNVERIFIED_ORG: DNA-binding transcriptional LysR family regulator [Pseudomonas reinekei]|uniref:hypothetical protein n=1 Tax=Pseudomonas laurylsulfatiphila TaxID=2011015 RepID=UPI003D215294|nr:DNA-binding transcriptional LysR family regulator [Pseudomonas reinekei]
MVSTICINSPRLMWAQSIGLPNLVQKHSPRFDSSLLAIEAAISGQGVVVVPKFLMEADLRSGSLVIPMHTDVMQGGDGRAEHRSRLRGVPGKRTLSICFDHGWLDQTMPTNDRINRTITTAPTR